MDIISEILFALTLSAVCIEIIKLYHETKELEHKVEVLDNIFEVLDVTVHNLGVELHGTQRFIRKECVTDCDLMVFKDVLTKNSATINVCDEKGTNE